MANATVTRIHNEQQADLMKQLEKAGAPMTNGSDSLDSLKTNSPIAKDILETMSDWDGAVYNFQSLIIDPFSTRDLSLQP